MATNRRRKYKHIDSLCRKAIDWDLIERHYPEWLIFGGEGVIAENVRHEQREVIKYNQLVANTVILYNVQWMSRKLKDLQQKG